MIKITCYNCGKKLEAPDEAEGKQGRCPECKAVFMITDGANLREGQSWASSSAGLSKKITRKLTEKLLLKTDNADPENFNNFVFSPDSTRLAYEAEEGDKKFVVVDGKEGKRYDSISYPIFSPDGAHVAYRAEKSRKLWRRGWACVVVDGKEGKRYDGIWLSPIFSPDSTRLAYKAEKWFFGKGFKKSVVVDGEEGKRYDSTCPFPIFSPDSTRMAYVAEEGDKEFVVVDGEEGKKYDHIFTLGRGRIVFDLPDTLHYLAQKGTSIYLVEEEIK